MNRRQCIEAARMLVAGIGGVVGVRGGVVGWVGWVGLAGGTGSRFKVARPSHFNPPAGGPAPQVSNSL